MNYLRWSAAMKKHKTSAIPVYNNTMTQLNRLVWRGYIDHCKEAYKKYPFEKAILKPRPSFSTNK